LNSLKKDDDPAIEEIKKVLDNIGYIDPVTKETSGKDYYIQLADQINKYFTDYLTNDAGIITLTDAYGVYNRARGVSNQ
jgi:ESCRT-II complex subunit VPS36